MRANISSSGSRWVKICFWLLPPRRMRVRKMKLYRDARHALRVVAALQRGQGRIHLGQCSMPPKPVERERFRVTCATRLKDHGVAHQEVEAVVLGIEERLDLAIQQIHDESKPGAEGSHAALRLKALLLARGVLP